MTMYSASNEVSYKHKLQKAEAQSGPKAQSSAKEPSTLLRQKRKKRKVIFLVVYFNAPAERDLSSHHHPSCKATQTLEKRIQVAFSSLFSIISFSLTCLDGPNDLLYNSFFIFS